jgi:negative regulator of replication initiation
MQFIGSLIFMRIGSRQQHIANAANRSLRSILLLAEIMEGAFKMPNLQKYVEEKTKPANETPQLDLLYRDIKIQMEELRELRPYKAAVEEIKSLIEFGHYSEEFNEVARIIAKHLDK